MVATNSTVDNQRFPKTPACAGMVNPARLRPVRILQPTTTHEKEPMPRFVAGLDLGSTSIKILVLDSDGAEITVRQQATPWTAGPGGTTDMLAADLAAALRHLILAAAADLPADAEVAALAVAGMGETGFVLNSAGEAIAPGFAWFDPRGAEQAAALPDELRGEFAGRTGLPWGVQVSAAKILYLRDGGLPLAGTRWVNLPEWAVAQLGGRLVGEYSLMSRTGLLDQSTGRPWAELLDHIGIDEDFLPDLVDAGTPLGNATADWLPPSFRGAALTVAGHDHLVAAVSGGVEPDSYHVSLGTAEVLLRVLDNPLSFDARRRLGDALINCVRHVRPGEYVLVAGVKTGLLMRRTLQLLGISDRSGRDALDEQVTALGSSRLADGAIEVKGARNDDGVLSLTVRSDGVSPAELFLAVLKHGNDEIRQLMAAMDREVPPPTTAVISGGWISMASVLAARSHVLPGLSTSQRNQETASGAALFARQLLAPQTTHQKEK